MNDCIFCKIIKGEIPSYKVYEDEHCLAFLDINPISRGHTLVLTKKHYSLLTNIPKTELFHLIKVVQTISKGLMKYSESVNIMQNNGESAGQVIPHVHIHIVPRMKGDGLHLGEYRSIKIPDMESVVKEVKEVL